LSYSRRSPFTVRRSPFAVHRWRAFGWLGMRSRASRMAHPEDFLLLFLRSSLKPQLKEAHVWTHHLSDHFVA
jgi:hypothetical protein